jgi:hypothetical protein
MQRLLIERDSARSPRSADRANRTGEVLTTKEFSGTREAKHVGPGGLADLYGATEVLSTRKQVESLMRI